MNQLRYLILDSKDYPLTHARLESPLDAPAWQLKLLDDHPELLDEHEVVKLVSMDCRSPDRTGQILRRREDVLIVKPTDSLGGDLRQKLRIPVCFNSFIYPLTGKWRGREDIRSKDLSCGGIAFYCARTLEPGELVETVIPVSKPPLIIKTEILHPCSSNIPDVLYAAKFVDMLDEEESLVQEAVFGLQILNRGPRRAV